MSGVGHQKGPHTIGSLDAIARQPCGDPKCTVDHSDAGGSVGCFLISPTCHAVPSVVVSYKMGTGALELLCPVCRRVVVLVAVAGELEAPRVDA